MAGNTSKQCPRELKDRAVRMVAEQSEGETEWWAMSRIAALLGAPETLRNWVRRSQVDGGARENVASEESAELKLSGAVHMLPPPDRSIRRGFEDPETSQGLIR